MVQNIGLRMQTNYTISFDRKFGSTDAGGKWVVRGMGFAPLAEENTKKAAEKEARKLADPGDIIEVRNKDGSLSHRNEFSG